MGALLVDCHSQNLFKDAEFWGAVLGREPESQEGQINSLFIRLEWLVSESQVILQKVDHVSHVHFEENANVWK